MSDKNSEDLHDRIKTVGKCSRDLVSCPAGNGKWSRAMNMNENDINILSRAAKIQLEVQGTHYVARYIGKIFNQEAPDLILEFESDEEHFIDDLEKALNEFIRDLTRRKINVVGIGITEMNLLIAELRDYEIMRKIDERNLEYMLKNHPEKVEGTPEHEKYMKELDAWEWRRLPFWQRLFWKGKNPRRKTPKQY